MPFCDSEMEDFTVIVERIQIDPEKFCRALHCTVGQVNAKLEHLHFSPVASWHIRAACISVHISSGRSAHKSPVPWREKLWLLLQHFLFCYSSFQRNNRQIESYSCAFIIEYERNRRKKNIPSNIVSSCGIWICSGQTYINHNDEMQLHFVKFRFVHVFCMRFKYNTIHQCQCQKGISFFFFIHISILQPDSYKHFELRLKPNFFPIDSTQNCVRLKFNWSFILCHVQCALIAASLEVLFIRSHPNNHDNCFMRQKNERLGASIVCHLPSSNESATTVTVHCLCACSIDSIVCQ